MVENGAIAEAAGFGQPKTLCGNKVTSCSVIITYYFCRLSRGLLPLVFPLGEVAERFLPLLIIGHEQTSIHLCDVQVSSSQEHLEKCYSSSWSVRYVTLHALVDISTNIDRLTLAKA